MNNPYLEALIYESSSLYPGEGSGQSRHTATSHNADWSSEEAQSPYLIPFHAAEVVDSRLANAMIASWTSVCDNEVLMKDLLAIWLRCEYHFTAAFQKDLFLEDMAAGRGEFCSSLLVNIMLGYSCVRSSKDTLRLGPLTCLKVCYPQFSNRAQYWNPHSLMYRFIAEARRIWELEADQPRITTVQAGILFNVFYNLCGLDEVGQVYRVQAIALARRLGLFDTTLEVHDARIRHGWIFTAWSLFNWET